MVELRPRPPKPRASGPATGLIDGHRHHFAPKNSKPEVLMTRHHFAPENSKPEVLMTQHHFAPENSKPEVLMTRPYSTPSAEECGSAQKTFSRKGNSVGTLGQEDSSIRRIHGRGTPQDDPRVRLLLLTA